MKKLRWNLTFVVMLCSCGGTTGTEDIVLPGDAAPPAEDVSADVSDVSDASPADAKVADQSLDAQEAGYDLFGDAYRPEDFGRPDVKGDRTLPQTNDASAAGDADAGAPTTVPDAGAPDADAGRLRQTTRQVLAQFPGCLECIDDPNNQGNGADTCFDAMFGGGSCEDLADGGTGKDELGYCIETLQTISSSQCAAGMQVNPCLCGTTPPDKCFNGMQDPNGPCYPIYQEDLSFDIHLLQQNITNPLLGAGLANAIVQCVQAFGCPCFVNAADGGSQ